MGATAQVQVGTTATLLVASEATVQADGAPLRAYLLKTASSVVYVGPAGVTAATGYLLAAGSEYPVELAPVEALYAVTSSGTATVYVAQLAAVTSPGAGP